MQKLHGYIDSPPPWATGIWFAKELAEYIEEFGSTPAENLRTWDESFLPQIILMMVYDQRRRRESHVTDIQDSYEAFQRVDEQSKSASVLKDVTGSDVIPEIVDKLLRADHFAVTAKYVQFAQEVYDRGGLREHIFKTLGSSGQARMTGMFGTTQLASWVSGGRVTLSFYRKDAEGYDVGLFSFILDDDDCSGITGGLSARYADALIALSMIDEVMTVWKQTKGNAKKSRALFSAV